jgi:hypothetical protein
MRWTASSAMCSHHDVLPCHIPKSNDGNQPWTKTSQSMKLFLNWLSQVFCYSNSNLIITPDVVCRLFHPLISPLWDLGWHGLYSQYCHRPLLPPIFSDLGIYTEKIHPNSLLLLWPVKMANILLPPFYVHCLLPAGSWTDSLWWNGQVSHLDDLYSCVLPLLVHFSFPLPEIFGQGNIRCAPVNPLCFKQHPSKPIIQLNPTRHPIPCFCCKDLCLSIWIERNI